jgi:hypothetical protein
MNFAKRLLMVFGAVALAAIIGTILTPKALHAVATAVQVVNPPANPVPTLATDALNSFVAVASCKFGNPAGFPADLCFAVPLYKVPQNKIAVIESSTGRCITDVGTTAAEFLLFFTGPDGSTTIPLRLPPSPSVTISGPSAGPGGQVVSTLPRDLKTYVSGGASGNEVDAEAFASAAEGATRTCEFTISGHLVPAQ